MNTFVIFSPCGLHEELEKNGLMLILGGKKGVQGNQLNNKTILSFHF